MLNLRILCSNRGAGTACRRTNLDIKEQIFRLDVPVNYLLFVTVCQSTSKACSILEQNKVNWINRKSRTKSKAEDKQYRSVTYDVAWTVHHKTEYMSC
jgi:hypothetical protein